jgi:hypothetical protein
VVQLKLQLAACNREPRAVANRPDSRPIEVVTAVFRLHCDLGEVPVDSGDRRGVGTEADELRVMAVSSGCPAQYSSRE